MTGKTGAARHTGPMPSWVPEEARHYLAHTRCGLSMRHLARTSGRHASTVLRQIRQLENRRDDQLVDQALRRLGRVMETTAPGTTDFGSFDLQAEYPMTQQPTFPKIPDAQDFEKQAFDVLTRLSEKGALLAVAVDMEKAIILRENLVGTAVRTGVVDRSVAEAMALKSWIDCAAPGRVSRYHITCAGRSALTQLTSASNLQHRGFAEAQAGFSVWQGQENEEDAATARSKYHAPETPLALLARRRDKNGNPFLGKRMITAGERLREDFELSIAGQTTPEMWEAFLSTGALSGPSQPSYCRQVTEATQRVSDALTELGPGLADIALRCCCLLEGLESTEKRMGWSARSGKIVLRIALDRLGAHYASLGAEAKMIG